MDKMKLHRMEYYGYHGVFEEERKLGNVSISIWSWSSICGKPAEMTI